MGSAYGVDRMAWAFGDVIVHREIAWGRPWFAIPERVVADTDALLVTFIPTGAPFGYAPGPWPTETGLQPWYPRESWEGHGVLVLMRPGENASEADILGFLDGRLARYKIPKSVQFASGLPRTATGKILKKQLRETHGGTTA